MSSVSTTDCCRAMLTERTAHEICFPDLTTPCPPPTLLFSPQRYSLLCMPSGAVLCYVLIQWGFYQIVVVFCFFFFLTINYFKLYPTPIIKQHCCWGLLTFRLFPELPCLFSNTKQANKQGIEISLHWFISAPVFSYGNKAMEIFLHYRDTQQHKKKETWNQAMVVESLEEHLFEARTPHNSLV